MIEYKEVKRMIRFKLKDNNRLQFSDYDIRGAVNETIRYLNNSYALDNTDFLEREKLYRAEEYDELVDETQMIWKHVDFSVEGVELPEDFISLVDVVGLDNVGKMRPVVSGITPRRGEFKVLDGRIYSGEQIFKIVYKRFIQEIDTKEENPIIELPRNFIDAVVKLAILILKQAETDVMDETFQDTLRNIIPRRRYPNARIQMPFYC